MAVNLAVAAGHRARQARSSLVDAASSSATSGVLLNLNPKNKSIADLVPESSQATARTRSLDTFVINHSGRHPRPARAAHARRWPS